MVGGEHSHQISAPQLLRFGLDKESLEDLNKRITNSANDKGVCRTALATNTKLTRAKIILIIMFSIKNSAYQRHQLFQPMRIEAPILIIYAFGITVNTHPLKK